MSEAYKMLIDKVFEYLDIEISHLRRNILAHTLEILLLIFLLYLFVSGSSINSMVAKIGESIIYTENSLI